METNKTIVTDNDKDKARRLLDYLTHLARLGASVVRSIDSYPHLLWLHEIPNIEKFCVTQAQNQSVEYDPSVWIEVRKFKEPVLDKVPEVCASWVDETTLYNTDNVPELLTSITVEEEQPNPDASQREFVSKTLNLSDHPDVTKAWEEFFDGKWYPWAQMHQQWQSVHKIYTRLFSIYQEQQKLGEQYELLLGAGLLSWQTPSGQFIRRHLLTARAALVFEPNLGKFTVISATEGAQLAIELDMLDIEDQPLNSGQLAKEALLSAEDNPWNRESVDLVLNILANSFADKGQGEYHPDHLEPCQSKAQSKPIVDYAPALILRKRSARGLEQVLSEIRRQIDQDGKIPPQIADICELECEHHDSGIDEEDRRSQADESLFFPLPSNEQQREIVDKLRATTGVLVQGPPGTGKSHTIANLICHLLATDKRVLVTAKTPRALQVLHQKLPPQIQPLCISLLGSGVEEQRSLESSVSAIMSKQNGWNDGVENQQIERLQEKLNQLRAERAELDYRVRSIREEETFQQNIVDGRYRGTAAKIALQIKKESAEFDWLPDTIAFDTAIPLSHDAINEICEVLSSVTPELERELEMAIPDPVKHLPSQEVFDLLVSQEARARKLYSNGERFPSIPCGRMLENANLDQLHCIIEAASNLVAAVESIRKRPMPWIEQAVYDMLTDKDTPWKELLGVMSHNIEGLKDRARKVDVYSLSIPVELDHKKLLFNAKTLKGHFDAGGKISWGLFKPKIIRENRYLLENVAIDGQQCNSSVALGKIIEYLTVEQQLEYLWSLWTDRVARKNGPLFMQVAELEESQEALVKVVALYDLLESAKDSVSKVQGLEQPLWSNSELVSDFLYACDAVIAKHDLQDIQGELEQHLATIRSFANRLDAHPIAHQAVSLIRERQTDQYLSLIKDIEHLRDQSELLRCVKHNLDMLAKVAPKLANELYTDPKKEKLRSRLKQIDQAWAWARANAWLRNFLNKEDMPSIESRLQQIDRDINECLAELASIRAWKYCFAKMEESHRRHLMGWQQAIRKIGKGTGKHAPKHRRDAQQHLNKCKDAVPAWIMPLHRVYETIQPSPGMFDVIIVDEASQCGPEALPLLYLSKRLLVVGDDKQISPEGVFVGRNQIHRLMLELLPDFSHADSFDVDSSLFDHGKLRFNNRIVLREHFRCMPEIIRFSNDLCYHDTPLIPLRQYPPQRLEPLKLVHVSSGYREGQGPKVINLPEARAIVDSIVECCSDPRYADKTMGVIVLQGDAQASIIENMLLESLGAEEMERRRLICGNPYSFQGDERHVIFLSMVAAPNEKIGAFTQAADQRRFNVAASRAQDQMWLFHTATRNDLSDFCLRKRLLDYFENPKSIINKALGEDADQLQKAAYAANRQIEKAPHPFESWFELDVALKIASRGFRVVPQYPVVENKRIDLVIEGTKSQLAVECDGDFWHGPDRYEEDMGRQRMLERSGWRFHRIRECEFNANPDKSLLRLWQQLDLLGILPVTDSVSTNQRPDVLDTKALSSSTIVDKPKSAAYSPFPITRKSQLAGALSEKKDSTGQLQLALEDQSTTKATMADIPLSNNVTLSTKESSDEDIKGYSLDLIDELYTWAEATHALDTEEKELLTCILRIPNFRLLKEQRKQLDSIIQKAIELGFSETEPQ